jgi:hypothetical protein
MLGCLDRTTGNGKRTANEKIENLWFMPDKL